MKKIISMVLIVLLTFTFAGCTTANNEPQNKPPVNSGENDGNNQNQDENNSTDDNGNNNENDANDQTDDGDKDETTQNGSDDTTDTGNNTNDLNNNSNNNGSGGEANDPKPDLKPDPKPDPTPDPEPAPLPTPEPDEDEDINDTYPLQFNGGSNDTRVVVSNNKLMLNGEQFVTIGFTNYTHSTASYSYIEDIMLDAKKAGANVIRVCDMVAPQYYDKKSLSSQSWKYEPNWVQTDFIISTAKKLGMKVLIDLSTFRKYFYERVPKVDCYDPEIFDEWDEIVRFIATRKNTFTNVTYANDPTIYAWAILGEAVPYGGKLYDFGGGMESSRDSYLIVNAILHIAEKIKHYSPNVLVQSGGMLHLQVGKKVYLKDGKYISCDHSGASLYGQEHKGCKYYEEALWSNKNIDFATIHIYPNFRDIFNSNGTLNTSKLGYWEQLSDIKARAAAYGKPLEIEEFGVDRTIVSNQKAAVYLQYCFDKMTKAGIRNAIIWNLGYGNAFDVGPQAKQLWEIVNNTAKLWRTTAIKSQAITINNPMHPLNSSNIVSETLISSFEKSPLISLYGGNQTASTPILNTNSTQGRYSVKLPVNLKNGYGWYDFGLGIENSVKVGTNDYLAVDAFIPSNIDSISIRMGFKANWVAYFESDYSWQTNYLVPGEWRTIYIPLKQTKTNAYGSCYNGSPRSSDTINTIELSIRNLTTTGETYILFDNLRLVTVK